MAQQAQFPMQNDIPPLEWCLWSVDATQQWLPKALPCYLPPLKYCNDYQPAFSYYHQSPPPAVSSTQLRSSNQPETPRHRESQDLENSTIEFSPSKYFYLAEDERFILEARLRKEPWKVIRASYMKRFPGKRHTVQNALNMKLDRLKKKYSEVRQILNERISTTKTGHPTTKRGRPVTRKKRRAARASWAEDDTPAGENRDKGAQQLSCEDAIEAGQKLLDFLGQPGNDGLAFGGDCIALLRIVGLLDRPNPQ
ncbi:reverse transcriptase and rnase h [Colletotrichum incanum]|uniref:Reverse transcriptase and rnase h n=1 Tax=Colletotrichum incanum TaxID=1573173 RepID=A0A161VZ45_COLIC|nr:reverse transcriptase and rnase h [Colletotrichum incanum]